MSSGKIVYREAKEDVIPFMKEMLIDSCLASGVTSIHVENLHDHPDTEINIKG